MAATTAGKPAARKPATRASKTPSKTALQQQQEAAEAQARAAAEAEEAAKEITFDADGIPVLPASKGSAEDGQFRFRIPETGGRLWALPNLQYLAIGEVLKFTGKTTQEAMIAIFSKYEPEILDHVDSRQILALAHLWKEHSKSGGTKVGLGESSP